MKSFDFLEPLFGNESFKAQITAMLEDGSLPHALLITAEDGCGKNLAARLVASAYLSDRGGLCVRGIHPDCLVVSGQGASGHISVDSVREASYELHKAAVMTDGRRAAIIRDVRNFNKSSANALLKILEQPPVGVIFILTASHENDLLETVRSRCVRFSLSALSVKECAEKAKELFPGAANDELLRLCEFYFGRLGLVKKTLESPERLALCRCAMAFIEDLQKNDRLMMLSRLDCASNKTEFQTLLSDIVFGLRAMLKSNVGNSERVDLVLDCVSDAILDSSRNINIKLLSARIAAQL